MERGQTLEVLHLVPNLVFVSLPPPLLIMFPFFSFLAFFTFFTQSIKYSADARITPAALCVLTIPGGFLY